MEILPKDIIRNISLYLSSKDVLSFSLAKKKFLFYISNSYEFWILKLSKDYNEIFKYYQNVITRHGSKLNITLKNSKNAYKEIYLKNKSGKMVPLISYLRKSLP
jgi:hypothetical protein